MTSDWRQGRSREGVPAGDPMIEVTVRIFPSAKPGDPSWPPQGGPFSGATVTWSYPEHLHDRALTRVAVVRHAISVLLDDLEGSTTVEAR
jgi:hypothetical protein